MAEGMKAALPVGDVPDLEKSRYVMFLTDGYIGNEAEILRVMDERLGQSRVFSFGVGSSVNRYLMVRMAGLGQGVASFVGNGEDTKKVVDGFWERVSRAPLTNVTIDWDGLGVSDMYPSRLPDLFHGRPIVVTGKFNQSAKANVRIEGTRAGQRVATTVAVDPSAKESKHSAIAAIWARTYIAQLNDTLATKGDEGGDVKQAMLETALNYNLMSQLTAFVAVDSAAVTEGKQGTTVHVAVPVPDGVKYDTTVGSDGGADVE
jgi:Ca-activated chloride channel family protein